MFWILNQYQLMGIMIYISTSFAVPYYFLTCKVCQVSRNSLEERLYLQNDSSQPVHWRWENTFWTCPPAKVSQKLTHYLWTVRSSILAEPSYPNLAPVPTKSQSRTRSSHHYKKRRKRKELVVTCCMLSGVPTDQRLAGCTPYRQGLPPCYSLRRRCFSDNEKPWFPNFTVNPCFAIFASVKNRRCLLVLLHTQALSHTRHQFQSQTRHNKKTATSYIYIYKGKKIKHPNPSISAALTLHVCDPALYQFSVKDHLFSPW